MSFLQSYKTRRPAYLFDELPAVRNVSYNLRRHREYQPSGRTARFASTYFENVLFELNLLDKESKTPMLLRNLNENYLQLSDRLKNQCTMCIT